MDGPFCLGVEIRCRNPDAWIIPRWAYSRARAFQGRASASAPVFQREDFRLPNIRGAFPRSRGFSGSERLPPPFAMDSQLRRVRVRRGSASPLGWRWRRKRDDVSCKLLEWTARPALPRCWCRWRTADEMGASIPRHLSSPARPPPKPAKVFSTRTTGRGPPAVGVGGRVVRICKVPPIRIAIILRDQVF